MDLLKNNRAASRIKKISENPRLRKKTAREFWKPKKVPDSPSHGLVLTLLFPLWGMCKLTYFLLLCFARIIAYIQTLCKKNPNKNYMHKKLLTYTLHILLNVHFSWCISCLYWVYIQEWNQWGKVHMHFQV